MFGIIVILLIIFVGSLCISDKNNDMRNRKLYCFLVFGSMAIFALLRGSSVGIDNAHRYPIYAQVCSYNWTQAKEYILSESDEYGYRVVCFLLSRILPTPHLMMCVFDLFIIISFGYFLYSFSEDITISSLMYLAFAFSSSLNLTRQYIAASFFLWAIMAIVKNKKLLSFFLILIAISFHTSGIALLAIYSLYLVNFTISRKSFIGTIIGAIIVFFMFDILIEWVIANVFPDYWWYTKSSWAIGNEEFSYLWLVLYGLLSLGFFITINRKKTIPFWHKKEESLDILATEKVYAICGYSFIIFYLTSMLGSKIWFLGRMKIYTIFSYIMIIPYLLKRQNMFNKKVIAILRIVFIIGLAVWTILIYKQNGNGLFPYVFFWE